MSNARNVGGVSARSGRRLAVPTHYLTARESAGIARRERAKAEQRGIFRRWNGRKLTAEQQALADLALKRTAAVIARAKARVKKPANPTLPSGEALTLLPRNPLRAETSEIQHKSAD
jgi:hypothetical protein